MLREFCEHEGEVVSYQKGERMECEGESANWFGFVTEGCFKYTTNGINDGKEHITWFSFEGEYVGDYPNCLDGRPAQTTIEAMLQYYSRASALSVPCTLSRLLSCHSI